MSEQSQATKSQAAGDAWTLSYDHWDPDQQPLREALCTLGNGYFATRGAAEEAKAGKTDYPGTYLAGGYNRSESEVSGRVIENEDLVNWPNWLCLSFRCEGEDWFDLDAAELLDFQQTLDLRCGTLLRRIRFRHASGRETSLSSRRLVHMADRHLAAIEWTLTPHNWAGDIELRTSLDGSVTNQGVARYRELNSHHLEMLDRGQVGEDGIYLSVQSNQSKIRMAQAARTHVLVDRSHASLQRRTHEEGNLIEQRLVVTCQREKPLRVEKVVAIFTSRDHAISEPQIAACEAIHRTGTFADLHRSHTLAWEQLWNRADLELRDNALRTQRVLRLHLFHLLQTGSFQTIDLDVGIPARGLHGEAYRGHIFWDELFIFPFLNLRLPELTRSLLMYRFRRLPAARRLAEDAGYRGAMFPWQSGSCGREESQVVHLNPNSGEWVPDHTYRQRHINSAIAYNVWQYFQTTGDSEFLSYHGAEIVLEIARFWASIATYNASRDRYEIHHVVGPDEFHTQYPDSDSPGLNNNTYTNVMAAWVLRCAARVFEHLAEDRRTELAKQLQIDDEELERWDKISRRIFVPFHSDGILSQFEGYEDLEEFDWAGYREKYGDIQRLDRILGAEGTSADRYKASKQADVLMLFYLFSSEELHELFNHLDYPFEYSTIPRNIDYYIRRTSHGSTLSQVVHSWVLARSDREQSWQVFNRAMESDIADVQGGTTAEGIHLGAMAGTVDLIQRCHTGIEVRDAVLWLNPCLPKELHEIRLRIRYRGHWLRLNVTHQNLHVAFEHGGFGPARVGVGGEIHHFSEGDSRDFPLPPHGPPPPHGPVPPGPSSKRAS